MMIIIRYRHFKVKILSLPTLSHAAPPSVSTRFPLSAILGSFFSVVAKILPKLPIPCIFPAFSLQNVCDFPAIARISQEPLTRNISRKNWFHIGISRVGEVCHHSESA